MNEIATPPADELATLSFVRRFFLAFLAFFYVLVSRRFAYEVRIERAQRRSALPSPLPRPVLEPPAEREETHVRDYAEALQLLGILQRDGRLVDFLEEDLAPFSDAEVGAAARTVHEGCKKAVTAYFTLEPVYREPEGAPIVVQDGFDPAEVRLTGNVVGKPPFHGSLKHHGWKAKGVTLPARVPEQDPTIVQPAEVEL